LRLAAAGLAKGCDRRLRKDYGGGTRNNSWMSDEGGSDVNHGETG